MGGRGETVRFSKFAAEKGNDAARKDLQTNVETTINTSGSETITVLALMEAPGGSVQFRATKAEGAAARQKLKDDVVKAITTSTETITVIALLQEPGQD
jgi:hypothetical protein